MGEFSLGAVKKPLSRGKYQEFYIDLKGSDIIGEINKKVEKKALRLFCL